MQREIRYYDDETKADFANTEIEKKPLPENYCYHPKNPLKKLRRLFIYRGVATPVVFLYTKLIRRIKYYNKECMKGYKKRGCFIYGNHVMIACDAANPTYVSFPRAADIVVNSDATSIKGIRWLIGDLGGMPIPDNFHQMGSFSEAVEKSIKSKHWVAIYPEAHIWPYYNKIRNFNAVSFRYPVKCDAPVFTYTLVLQKRGKSPKPKIAVCIDGPFFPDKNLNPKQAAQKLRDEVYNAMQIRAKAHSDCVYKYEYVPTYAANNEENSENK